mgnify:CR=1 FL=1|jgi:hypothetical protein
MSEMQNFSRDGKRILFFGRAMCAPSKIIQQQIVEAKKIECVNVLKELICLSKEFGFVDGMLEGALAESQK